jgi:predicted DNA-binding protein (MmcQ/YjbR family)
MNIEEIRLFCLSLKGTTEDLPFDESTLVFKVRNKIFVLTSLDKPFSLNLKCDPEKAIELRERYEAVQPGFHMNKKHWNTVNLDGSVSDTLIMEWILHSYNLVVKGLSGKERLALEKE